MQNSNSSEKEKFLDTISLIQELVLPKVFISDEFLYDVFYLPIRGF